MGSTNQIYPTDHEHFICDDAIVWRYVPLKTLFFYLAGNVFIPSIAKLQEQDPFEGKYLFETKEFEEALQKSCGNQFANVQMWIRDVLWTNEQKHLVQKNPDFPQFAQGYDKDCYFSFMSNTRYAWCWFQSESESAAMWNTYGKEGVAIAATVGSLSAALKTTLYDFVFGKMCYYKRFGNYPLCSNADKEAFRLRPDFLKREEYRGENEMRYVTSSSQRESGGLLLENIKPETWVKEIRLWPGLTLRDAESIITVVGREAPAVPCSRSHLLQTHRNAKTRMFEDFKERAVATGEEKWMNGQDGVPTLLKNPRFPG